jgi:LAO/AO transport system kinase
MMVSAVEETGLDKAWLQMCTLADWRKKNGVWGTRRAEQARYWFEQEVKLALLDSLRQGVGREALERFGKMVEAGDMTSTEAAGHVVKAIGRPHREA